MIYTIFIWIESSLETSFDAIIIGVVSSLIATIIWYFVFSKFRPNIEISEKIAKSKKTNGAIIYKIKIVNRGFRPVTDIKAKLSYNYINDEGLIKTKEIKLSNSELFCLPQFNKNDKDASYAYRFITNEDIDSKLKNDQVHFLRFRLYCIDSFSNLGKLFEKQYSKSTCIETGDFEVGSSSKIES